MDRGLNSSVLSIDVGTSGVRAALFDEEGNQIEGAQVTARRELAGFAELDPDALVDEVKRTVDELLAQSGHPQLGHMQLGHAQSGRAQSALSA